MFESFYKSLERKKNGCVFNPWFDCDKDNDDGGSSPLKRLNNLQNYLKDRKEAEFLFVAEALGYQGGHFSGIPMTSERIILGHKIDKGIMPKHVCGIQLDRTSKVKVKKDGFTEPTATIVWQKLIEQNLNTYNYVFWNAFPWHPYKPEKGMLSNRTPTEKEICEGKAVLDELLKAGRFKTIVALGNESYGLMKLMGLEEVEKVRHPANGGAPKFREQIKNII